MILTFFHPRIKPSKCAASILQKDTFRYKTPTGQFHFHGGEISNRVLRRECLSDVLSTVLSWKSILYAIRDVLFPKDFPKKGHFYLAWWRIAIKYNQADFSLTGRRDNLPVLLIYKSFGSC